MTFSELTIHQKITLRGNCTIGNGRHFLVMLYNYYYLPADHRYYNNRKGNMEELEHRWINRPAHSYETISWMYGYRERRIDHTESFYNKKTDRRETRITRTEVIPAYGGPYGFAGVPWWKMEVMPIKRKRKAKKPTTQQELFA